VDFEVVWHHEDGTTVSEMIPAAAYAEGPAPVEMK